MNKKFLLVGEPMGLFIGQQPGPLESVDSYSFSIAGAEYNVAVGMCRLGHPVNYFTKLGDDPFGKRIAHDLAVNGIDTADVQWSEELRTGFMLKNQVSTGDPAVFYFRKGSAASTLEVADVERIDLTQYQHLHLTGILPALSQSCLEATQCLMERARKAGLFISFDPNLRPVLWPGQKEMVDTINRLAVLAHLVLPGIGEGVILTGSDDPRQIADYYLTRGVEQVVVKLGSQGALLASHSSSAMVEGFAVEQVVDTVGAGDGFAVGVLSALAEGLTPTEAVRRGNAIGAIQVMSPGDNEGLPTRPQLESFIATGKKAW